MSSKHREIAAWLLLLAAVLSLTWGTVLLRTESVEASEGTTYPTVERDTEYPVFSSADAGMFSTTLVETVAGIISATDYPVTEAVSETRPVSVTGNSLPTMVTDASGSESRSLAAGELLFLQGTEVPDNGKTLGIILCLLGGILAVIGVFVLRRRQPMLGPDGILALAAVLCWLPLQRAVASVFLQGLLLLFALLCLREFFGWLLARCNPSWCASERLARRTSAPQTALLCYLLWILLPIAAAVSLLCWYGLTVRAAACLLLLLSAAALGVLCGMRYGAGLGHFQQQLERFRAGEPVRIREGPFASSERELEALRAAHAEAVQKAVVGERFRVDLIANVSHDLRTPLTAILGYGELLEKQPLPEEARAQLARLTRKAGYMRELVDSLFELTKVSSGVLTPKRAPIDLIRLLEQTVGLFDDQFTASGLCVKRQYAVPSAPLITDGAMLHQVFANLLGNAVKYALKGTRIYLELSETEGGYRVRLINTASYEMDFTAEEIVQRFARGDKARSTQGSGIGLAIAQTYTEAVGGVFRVIVDGDQFNAIVTLPKTDRNL